MQNQNSQPGTKVAKNTNEQKKYRPNPLIMNATATVISSSILQLTFEKFMQV